MIFLKKIVFVFLFLAYPYAHALFPDSKREKDSAHIYYKKALQLDRENDHYLAYKYILRARELYKTGQHQDSVALANLAIFKILLGNEETFKESLKYLDLYHSYGLKESDSIILMTSNYYYANYYFEDSIKSRTPKYYLESLKYAKGLKRISSQANIYNNLGLFYTSYQIDSAKYYFEKSLVTYPKEDPRLFQAYLNYANYFQVIGQCDEALEVLKKAQSFPTEEFSLNLKKIIYKKISECYSDIGMPDLSLKYLKTFIVLKDSVDLMNKNLKISELNKKYQNAEKEKEILEKRNWLIALGALLVILLITGSFSLKNSRRKRLLALQEKEIETQKNLTLLKEQEISTINAMVEGQEKERKRVAEDLHDNLGSVIATLKLHFENLRINRERKKIDQEQLFDKTENLIDEAYQKVRSIAHAKNAGVIANQGLLFAVKLMAEKISVANTIQIDVIDYGLENSMENSLEIALFRIIQELTTNIIKHAQANHATINISLDEEDITILIEDNGIGMNTSQIDLQKGMGLHSIKTRVEHLEGTFTIDSTPSKGTTIIINIPI